MALGESVDTVVEQYDIDINVSAVGMDEVVAADGQTIAVTADLPYTEMWVGHFATGGNGGSAAVDGVHAVCGHVVGQA